MADIAEEPTQPKTGPKEVTQPPSPAPSVPSGPSIPYRVTTDKFDAALRTLRQSPGSVEVLQVTLGASDRPFLSRVLTLLGLITNGHELTPTGRRIAFADGNERDRALLRAMWDYEPYKLVLKEVARRKGVSLPAPEVVAIWREARLGQNDDNRTSAATAFAAILESAHAGKYVLGRRGSPSRVDFPQDFQDRLTAALGDSSNGSELPPRQDDPGVAGSVDSITHKFPLRANLAVEFKLPTDLTQKDVDRLSRWLSTLPFTEEN